jgi:polygalacturonase
LPLAAIFETEILPFNEVIADLEAVKMFSRAQLVAFLCLFLPGQTQSAPVSTQKRNPSSEVWVAVRADGVSGKGTSNDPFDGSTSTKFDGVMAAIPSGATIHIMEGTFLTHGIVPKSGWRLYLTDKTTLRLDVLAWISGQKWSIVTGAPNPVSNILIEGGVWDCNLQNQKIALAAQAISFVSDEGNVTIRNIKVINWGSTFPHAECFAVSVFNVGGTNKIARNIVFDGVEVTQPAPVTHRGTSTLIGAHGQDTVNPSALSSGWLDGVEIRNCYVHDIDLPLMTGAVGMGSWCRGVHIHHNRFERLGPASDTLFGCYIDTGASEDLLIEDNRFAGVPHGVFANVDAAVPIGRWVIRGNTILINRNGSAGGIELRSSKATMRNVLVENNTIQSLTGELLNATGILLRKVSAATIRDNIVNDISGSNQIVFEKGVTDFHLLNNRSRTGPINNAKTTGFF